MPYRCDGDGAQPRWRVSGAVGAVSTDIVFGGGDADTVEVEQVTVGASAGWFPTWKWGVTVSAGALVAGTVEGRALGPGGQLAVGASYLARRERKRRPWPFVLVTGSFAGVVARGEADDGDATYGATDLRVGVAAGRSVAQGKLTGYVAARAFGGPVFWRRGGERVVGGDRYHVTAGVGVTVRVPGVMDLGVEVLPLGEQGVTASVTVHR